MVYGEKRYGKSIYALKNMWAMFMALGVEKEEAFRMADERMLNQPGDFIQFIYDAQDAAENDERDKELVVCLDDASIGLSGQNYDRPETKDAYWEMRDIWAEMGTAVSAAILTTPDPEWLSDKYTWNMKVHVSKTDGHWGRKAEGFSCRLMGKRKTRKDTRQGGFTDTFSGRLSNAHYAVMRGKRMKYLRSVREKHREIREKKFLKLKESEIAEAFGPSPAQGPERVDEHGVQPAVGLPD